MDPDTALALLRAYVALCLDADANNRPRPFAEAMFPEQFDALDKWLSHGGFLPQAWQARTTFEPATDEKGNLTPSFIEALRGQEATE
jgi:hypothetical protein